MSGVTPSLTLEKITIGSVVDPGPEVKLAMTRSSSDRVKASSQPETIAGAMIGSVMSKSTCERPRAEVHRGLLQRAVDVSEARLHDDGDIGHGEGGVGDDDGQHAAAVRPADEVLHGDEEQQQRQAGDDFRHDQRRGDHAGEQRAAAEAREARQRHAGQGAEDRREGGARSRATLERQPGRVDDLLVVEERPYHLVEKPPQTVTSRDSLKEKTISERIGT